MAKYTKTQIDYILNRLKAQFKSKWGLQEELRKKYTPKKPKAVVEYEEKCEQAKELAEREAVAKTKEKEEYIQKVKDELFLSNTEFDIEKAIKELKSL